MGKCSPISRLGEIFISLSFDAKALDDLFPLRSGMAICVISIWMDLDFSGIILELQGCMECISRKNDHGEPS